MADEEEPEVIVCCPSCGHKQPKTWEGFDPVAEMECGGCSATASGWTPAADDEGDDDPAELADLAPALRGWARCCWSDFEVDWRHVLVEIPLARPVEAIKGIRASRLLSIVDQTRFPDEELAMWVNVDGRRLFSGKSDVRSSLSTITEYVDGVCKSDAGDRLRCIIVMLEEDKKGDAYDRPKLLLAMAQNGNLCHVQKEVGIRSVYASMTGTGKADADSKSAQTQLLSGLLAMREALVDAQAAKVCNRNECGIPQSWRDHATHFLVPVRNSYHKRSGLPYMPDLRRIDGGRSEFENVRGITPEHTDRWFREFAATYSSWQIHWCAEEAVNAKKVPYEATNAWFQDHPPAGVDSHEFRSEFVFNMETGKIAKRAIYYMLVGMGVLKGIAGFTVMSTEEEEGREAIWVVWRQLWKGWDRMIEEEAQVRWRLGEEYSQARAELEGSQEAQTCRDYVARLRQLAAAQKSKSGGKEGKAAMARMRVERRKVDAPGALPDGLAMRPAADADEGLLSWQGTLTGPDGSPYEGGTFRFAIEIPPTYPKQPPEVRVLTKVHHPQVNSTGRFDLATKWTAKLTLVDCVQRVVALLSAPELGDDGGDEQVIAAWRREARRLTEQEAM